MQPALTRHAQARMQQRAIRPEVLERLLEFGREAFDHHGGVVIYFDKAARRRLSRAAPGVAERGLNPRLDPISAAGKDYHAKAA